MAIRREYLLLKMIRLKILTCFFVVCILHTLVTGSSEEISYKGHKLFLVKVTSKLEVAFLRELENDPNLNLDFWTHPVFGDVNIHVNPHVEKQFVHILKEAGLKYSVIEEDLQREIEAEKSASRNRRDEDKNFKKAYLMLSEIDEMLDNIVEEFPNRVKRFNLDKTTYEGRQLWGVKVSANLSVSGKKAVWLVTGTHAREFITIAVSLGIIDKLARLYGEDGAEGKKATEMLDNYDWYFIPVHNPDGYNYAKTVNRFWRKNRRRHNMTCPDHVTESHGVDLNRNWNVSFGEGSWRSSFECIDSYHGIAALSEPETSALNSAVTGTKCVVAFISLHAYSQIILLPWSFNEEKPEDYETLYRIAMRATAELESHYNTTYTIGTPSDIFGPIPGTPMDHMKLLNGIKYVLAYELRPDMSSKIGFLLPETEIGPTVTETFASLWKLTAEIYIDENASVLSHYRFQNE